MLFRVRMPDGGLNAYEFEVQPEFYTGRSVRTTGLLKATKYEQLDGQPWYIQRYPFRNVLASPEQVQQFEQAVLLTDAEPFEALPLPENLSGY